tara:strand:- start:341 stop:442 length:102 start_codon:yes stop_codon:yes gene_type:complete
MSIQVEAEADKLEIMVDLVQVVDQIQILGLLQL